MSGPLPRSRFLPLAFALAAVLPSACTTTPSPGLPDSAGEPRRLSMGMLVGREARVGIFATPGGVRYDIRTPEGQLVASGLTAAEVARHLPGQDPRGAWADLDRPLQLMQADTLAP